MNDYLNAISLPTWQRKAMNSYRKFIRRAVDEAIMGRKLTVVFGLNGKADIPLRIYREQDRIKPRSFEEQLMPIWASDERSSGAMTKMLAQDAMEAVRTYYLEHVGIPKGIMDIATDFGQTELYEADDDET